MKNGIIYLLLRFQNHELPIEEVAKRLLYLFEMNSPSPTLDVAMGLLRDLVDIQNGAPLVQDEDKWKDIMDKSYTFLAKHNY